MQGNRTAYPTRTETGAGAGASEGVGPAITAVTESATAVVLTIANGAGLHWAGTKQCTRCCGLAPLPPGSPRGTVPHPYGGKGLTNSYPMEMLNINGWQYISAQSVALSNSTVTVPLVDLAKVYWPPTLLRYAWQDFPECAIYTSNGLPLPPFNISLNAATPPPPLDRAGRRPSAPVSAGQHQSAPLGNWSIVPLDGCKAPIKYIKWCTQGP